MVRNDMYKMDRSRYFGDNVNRKLWAYAMFGIVLRYRTYERVFKGAAGVWWLVWRLWLVSMWRIPNVVGIRT